MKLKQRNIILVYLFIALIGIILLAGSISNLKFIPGLPIPGAVSNNQSPSNSTVGSTMLLEKQGLDLIVIEIGIGISFVLLSILITYSLVKKTNKRKFGLFILGIITLIIIFNILNRFKQENSISGENPDQGSSQLLPLDYEVVPIEQPPSELFWMVGIGLLIGCISFGAFLFLRANQKPMHHDGLIEEVDSALQAIRDGKDLGNIIINYYLQLNQIIKEEYEIEREKSLTAREFENYLCDRGIPIKPIHQITTIFEKVRYGNKLISDEDEKIVIESLVEIRSSCLKNRSIAE